MLLLGFNKLQLSEKLEKYIKKIEEETGRPSLIKNVQYVGFDVMVSAFRLDPEFILAEIIEEKFYDSKGEINQEDIECMIAHEVTHGLLTYKKKYCQFKFVLTPSELEESSASLLFTMIEDIVVNKIIDKKHFLQPLIKPYINWTSNREIKPLSEGKDCYEYFNKYSPIFKDRYMVSRYIQAWGFLKYFNFNDYNKGIINKYLEIFQKSYPRQYEQAIKIKDIILENDIFTPEGYCNTIKECLDLWNLTHLVGIFTCQRYDFKK